MRIICKNCVMEIFDAACVGKRLVFKAYNGQCYHTGDYYAENIALCKLKDLAKNGYINVSALYEGRI